MSAQENNIYVIRFQDNYPEATSKVNYSQNKKLQLNRPKKLLAIPISIVIIIIIIIAAFVVWIILKDIINPPIDKQENIIIINKTKNNDTNEIIDNFEIPQYMKEKGPLEMQLEYIIKTEEKDFIRIYINQKYYEYTGVDGFLTKTIIDRKTNYDIFILKKIEAPNREKYFYNYTYLCSIAISSECISSNDEYCIPKKLLDLNEQDKSNLNKNQGEESLENIPIHLCFFNLTDNNVITSIACHKKLNQSKINLIVLDLYFFRPPAIKRINQEGLYITITKTKDGNNEIITETNKGICDINNPIGSFCSTDMKTTKGINGTLSTYEEVAFTNITRDENNYYYKNKSTNLIDKTSYLLEYNPEKYNEILNKFYQNLKKYLEYYELFSLENFHELYNISKGIKDVKNLNRRLSEEKPININKIQLFNFIHPGGVDI